MTAAVTGLSYDTTYRVTVMAVNMFGEGTSAPFTFRTAPCSACVIDSSPTDPPPTDPPPVVEVDPPQNPEPPDDPPLDDPEPADEPQPQDPERQSERNNESSTTTTAESGS